MTKASTYFLIVGILLIIYTFIFVDDTHHFILNLGWETNLIEAKWLFLLVAGIGICLAVFYRFFAKEMYSQTIIYLHIATYLLLGLVLVLWDNNSFSLQEAVESKSYSSIHEIRRDYHQIIDRSDLYRTTFWILLILQPLGLLNLILAFLKPNEDRA